MDEFKPFQTGALPKSVRDTHSLLARATKADIRQIIAGRLLSSREINGFSQTDAAKKFGYSTPAQLSQWEQCRRMPPLQMLVRASSVYRVSLDYIMGVSDEPDRDPASTERRQVLCGVEDAVKTATLEIYELAMRHIEQGGPTVEMSHSMLREGEQFHRAVTRFMEINKDKFEDMLGGSPLAGMAERFESNCLGPARQQIARHKHIHSAADKRLSKKTRRPDQVTGDIFIQSGA